MLGLRRTPPPRRIFDLFDNPSHGRGVGALARLEMRLAGGGLLTSRHTNPPQIFDLFDNLILMKKGQIVYQGACQKSLPFLFSLPLSLSLTRSPSPLVYPGACQKSLLFLEMIGKPCPQDMNPADFLIDSITAQDAAGYESDEQTQQTVPVDLNLGDGMTQYQGTQVDFRTWARQLWVLFLRCGTQYLRRTDLILMNLILTVVIAVFVSCGIWRQIGVGQDSIAKRGPSLFFASVCQVRWPAWKCV